jgi:hypothetical protein
MLMDEVHPHALPLQSELSWLDFDLGKDARAILKHDSGLSLCVTVGRVNTARLLDMCGNHG